MHGGHFSLGDKRREEDSPSLMGALSEGPLPPLGAGAHPTAGVQHSAVGRVAVGFQVPSLPASLCSLSPCSQIQPFFSSCLNDCDRRTATISCPKTLDPSGRRRTAVLGLAGVENG